MQLHSTDTAQSESKMKSAQRNFQIDLKERVDALSANRDNTKIVAASSRGLLKIFSAHDDRLELVSDMRSMRTQKHSLIYSANSVAWSPLIENIIATASTNGAIALWNVETGGLYQLYKAHARSATKVCFHRSDQNTFISGAKDAVVVQHDMRCSSYVQKFMTGSCDSLRDMQFGIHEGQMNIFVCGDEGGSVHFWDVRRSSRPLKQFVAHRDTTSVQLSPNYVDRNLLATAGRDRFIRIWNWSDRTDGSTDASIYSVETLAPLALIRWRPQHKYQLASCAFVGDTNIYVWDIRRPFIPFASFDDHRSVCCDMLWKDGIADSFVAASSDGVIMIHRFENAHQPLAHANDIAVDVSPSGEIIIASSDQLKVKNEALADIGKLKQGAVSPPRPNNYDPFRSWAHSSLIRCLPQEKHVGLSPDRLIYFARNYKLSGSEPQLLCRHNCRVAEKMDDYRTAYTWRVLELLCSMWPILETSCSKRASYASNSAHQGGGIGAEKQTHSSHSWSSESVFSHVVGREEALSASFTTCVPPVFSQTFDFYFGETEHAMRAVHPSRLRFIANRPRRGHDSLQMEAFLPRCYDGNNNSEDTDSESTVGAESCHPTTICDISSSSGPRTSGTEETRQTTLNIDSFYGPPPWDPLPLIHAALIHYADNGDVQTCVSILLVVGERTSEEMVDVAIQKLWFLDYLDVLDRYELWVTSAEIIKLCWIPSVSILSHQSTSMRLRCTTCKALSVTASSHCKRCGRSLLPVCAVCHCLVEGVWGWCRGCRHGGHPKHLLEWFSSDKHCPTGCGHRCTALRK